MSDSPLNVLAISADARYAKKLEKLLPVGEFFVRQTSDPLDDRTTRDRDLHAFVVDFDIGESVIQKLIDRRPGLPILVLTALDDEAEADSLLEAGATDIVMKDGINPGRLQRAVRRAVARHRGAASKFGAVESLLRRFQLMESLFSIVSNRQLSVEDQIDDILREGCRLFQLPIGMVSRIEGTKYTVRHVHAPGGEVDPGQHFELGGTLCAITIDADGPVGIDDLRHSQWNRHPAIVEGIRAYIGVPIFVNDERYGTLSFSGMSPLVLPFPEIDIEFIRTLGDWMSAALTRAHLLGELRVLATHDGLTGLPNRAAFTEHAEKVLRRAQRDSHHPMALLFLDLNGFKKVNDSHGHIAGDTLLQLAAQRIVAQTRTRDFVSRFGGDEFVVLVDGVELQTACDAAERIIASLERPFDIGGEMVEIGCSVGIATSVGEDEINDLVQAADEAMYSAKRDKTRISTVTPRRVTEKR